MDHEQERSETLQKPVDRRVGYERCLLGMPETSFIKSHQYWLLNYELNKDKRHAKIEQSLQGFSPTQTTNRN